MVNTIDLMVPVVPEEPPPSDLHLAARGGFPDGARLTLIDNGKPRARELMLMIAEGLRDRFPVASVEVYSKGAALPGDRRRRDRRPRRARPTR